MKAELNNQNIIVHNALVSKYPINQVWSGYQRNRKYTANSYFITFDIDKKSILKLKFSSKIVDDIQIKPCRYNLTFLKTDEHSLEINLDKPCQFVIENGEEVIHVFCNEVFKYEYSENDIYFAPGVHHAGVIAPQSGQRICIDQGAIVYGAIVGYKIENVEIIGRGILDSSKILCPKEANADKVGGEVMKYFRDLGHDFDEVYVAGNLVLWNCNNVKVSGIILVDSPSWSVIARNDCKNILIDNIKIIGQWRYNSDGIDICCCENVLVENCFIRSFDDCLVVRAPYLYGEDTPVNNIRFRNCVLWCDWGKSLEVWCGEKECLISNVVFEDLYLIKLTHYAISLTTTYGSANTRVKNITYRNIYIDTDEFYPEPVYQQLTDEEIPENPKSFEPTLIMVNKWQLGKDLGNQKCKIATDVSSYHLCYEDIHFENIFCKNRKLPIIIEADEPVLTVKNISFSNVDSKNIKFYSCK